MRILRKILICFTLVVGSVALAAPSSASAGGPPWAIPVWIDPPSPAPGTTVTIGAVGDPTAYCAPDAVFPGETIIDLHIEVYVAGDWLDHVMDLCSGDGVGTVQIPLWASPGDTIELEFWADTGIDEHYEVVAVATVGTDTQPQPTTPPQQPAPAPAGELPATGTPVGASLVAAFSLLLLGAAGVVTRRRLGVR